MKRIKWIFLLLMVLGTMLYWVSLTDVERTLAPWALRKSLLYYTGVMSFMAMSVCVILALRLRIVERCVGGLDTHYRLHKWLGIAAALISLFKKIGANHRPSGKINQIQVHEDGKVTEVEVFLTHTESHAQSGRSCHGRRSLWKIRFRRAPWTSNLDCRRHSLSPRTL